MQVAICLPSLEKTYPKFKLLEEPAQGDTVSYNSQSSIFASYIVSQIPEVSLGENRQYDSS